MSIAESALERGRLPVCGVRIRSLLFFMICSLQVAKDLSRKSALADTAHGSARRGGDVRNTSASCLAGCSTESVELLVKSRKFRRYSHNWPLAVRSDCLREDRRSAFIAPRAASSDERKHLLSEQDHRIPS